MVGETVFLESRLGLELGTVQKYFKGAERDVSLLNATQVSRIERETTILDLNYVHVLQFQRDFIPQAELENAFIYITS